MSVGIATLGIICAAWVVGALAFASAGYSLSRISKEQPK
jgi:hypothetical protein